MVSQGNGGREVVVVVVVAAAVVEEVVDGHVSKQWPLALTPL